MYLPTTLVCEAKKIVDFGYFAAYIIGKSGRDGLKKGNVAIIKREYHLIAFYNVNINKMPKDHEKRLYYFDDKFKLYTNDLKDISNFANIVISNLTANNIKIDSDTNINFALSKYILKCIDLSIFA